jgi:hypothetical protein
LDFLKKCLAIQRLRRPGVKSLAITGYVSASLGSRGSKPDEDSKFEVCLSKMAWTKIRGDFSSSPRAARPPPSLLES